MPKGRKEKERLLTKFEKKNMDNGYLTSVVKQFQYYQSLGEKAFDQLADDALFWQYNEESNSIATIVKHLWGIC
jgi:Protein of unknown function (DUF1572)